VEKLRSWKSGFEAKKVLIRGCLVRVMKGGQENLDIICEKSCELRSRSRFKVNSKRDAPCVFLL